MIKSIWGTCDGADILFRQTSAGLWETTVPARVSGEYTLSLWAEDAAGNRSYFCTVLLTFDITKLCCRFRVLDIGAGWSLDDVKTAFSCADVNVDLVRCDFCGEA